MDTKPKSPPQAAEWWSLLDAQWQTIFKAAIGIDSEPTEKELVAILRLTKLDCHGKKLTSLEPLRALTGLQSLNCRINELTSLEPLRACTYLRFLDCRGNHLTNLEPLRALTGLQTLGCSHNQLTSLEPLHGLKSLKKLECRSNPSLSQPELERFQKAVPSCQAVNLLGRLIVLSQVDKLTNNKQFWWLSLGQQWQAIFKEAIGINSEPTETEWETILSLTQLDCRGKRLTSLEPLRALTDLRFLACGDNGLTNLEPLRELTGLQMLVCKSNHLTSLEPLRACTGLSFLACGGNHLTSLEPLQACTGLQDLNCENNQLTSLEPLQACTGLQDLDCGNNQLTSLEPLRALTGLQSLNCENNQLTSLEPLQACTGLQSLNCGHNRLTSLEPLRACPGLQSLYCYSNQLTSLEPLRACLGLQSLDCEKNQLTSLEPLHGLKSLKKLKCQSNPSLSQPETGRFLTNNKQFWWLSLGRQWQAIFKEAIGINSEPTETEWETILSLTQLDCRGKRLTSLEPLRALTGLQQLDCDNNQLTSLEPLRVCTGLQTLNCENNQLTSLLTQLDCRGKRLTSLEPLRALTGLQFLACGGNRLTNLEPLRELTGLQQLDCDNNQLTSLEPLRVCTGLQTLNCENNQLTSLESLHDLKSLRKLECGCNPLSQPDMERFQKAVPSCKIFSTTRRDRLEAQLEAQRAQLEAQRKRDKLAAKRISEMTHFSPAFRTGLKYCKYTTWAADLTEEQLLVLLWLVGECMARISFIYGTLVEELPKSEGHQERKRMIIALKMLVDLLGGRPNNLQESPKEADSSANSEVTETPTGDTQHPLSLLNAIVDNMFDHILSRQPFSLEEVREHIDSSCNNKMMVQMQTLLLSEMSGFSEDFRSWLTTGKYTRWALHNLTEGSLFGLISLVGEYGHHAVFLREILHRRLEESRYYPGDLRITAAFKMLAKMVRGQRWSLDKMRSLIGLSPHDTKVLDDWPSIN